MKRRSTAAGAFLSLILILAGCGGGDSSHSPTPTPQPTPGPNGSFAPESSTATMNTDREDATATLLPNGKVLIAGGVSESGDLATVELYDPAANSFAPPGSTPLMNQGRWDATATLLANGKVLIAGGISFNAATGETILNTVELYDPATNTFARAASLPTMNTARDDATAVLLYNGKVLIAGGSGSGSSGSLNSVELYDPVANTFAPAASLPTMNAIRDSPSGTLLPNGEVLIAGGFEKFLIPPDEAIADTVDLYNPVTNTFAPATSLPTMNTPRVGAPATLLASGEVLITGGATSNITIVSGTTSVASVDLYNPMTNSFAPAASLPTMNTAREFPTATLLSNGKVLIAGGTNVNLSDPTNPVLTVLASVEIYDPTTNSFAPAASLPTMNTGRSGATATLLPNGKVLIAGGGENAGNIFSSTELYTPATGAP